MNWPKIKTYMIFGLIIANVFLFSLFYLSEYVRPKDNQTESLIKIKEILLDNGIDVRGLSGLKNQELPVINLSSAYKVNFTVLENMRLPDEEKHDIFEGKYTWIVDADNSVKVTSIHDVDENKLLTKDEILSKFISSVDGLNEKLSFECVKNYTDNDGVIKSEYVEKLGDYVINDGYIYFEEKDGFVEQVNFKVVEVTESSVTQDIIPFSKVLYGLLSVVDSADMPIKFQKVYIAYQLSVKLVDDDIESGEASPSYVFVGDKGEKYSINALGIRSE